MPTLPSLISFIFTHRKLLLAVIVTAAVWLHGWRVGAAGVREECDAAVRAQKEAVQEEKDRQQAEALKQSKAYQDELAARQQTLTKTQKELNDALHNNPALRDCAADAEFLRLYGSVASDRLPTTAR